MNVGDKIKKALKKVGVSYSIIRSGETSIVGEYLVYDQVVQSARPLFREYVLDANIQYDTRAVAGDILELSDSRRFLLTDKVADMFKDATPVYNAWLFKCNVTAGRILRSSGEVWSSQTYHKEQVWHAIRREVHCLVTPAQFGSTLDEQEIGEMSVTRLEAYLPRALDLRALDRLEVGSGEYYQVNVVRHRTYEGLIVAELTEDTR